MQIHKNYPWFPEYPWVLTINTGKRKLELSLLLNGIDFKHYPIQRVENATDNLIFPDRESAEQAREIIKNELTKN